VRPRRLRVKGYTAFVQEADVDFDGLDLFAITGPTGAGKTSLLQAMTIALYGRAPKLGDDLRQLISPLAERAHFFFEFQARGRDYRITRVMFRTRPTTVALEGRGDGGEWQTLTRGVREANARVEQVLGLDFDSFTKVVLLPQNEFDAFLRGKPDERRSILTRLLSLEIYGRIQQRANQVAAEARTQADLLTGLLERDYADATPEHLAELKEARAAAEAEAEASTARVTSLERAAAAALDARQRRGGHRLAAEDLAAHERSLDAAREGHRRAAGALAGAEHAVQTCAERLASISYDADRHLLLARAEERATRLSEVIGALIRVDGEDATGRARIAELTRQRDEAVRAVREVERALETAETAAGRARADSEEQQRRFGRRTTVAGLIERERRYREDRAQDKEVQRALDALTAREAELTTQREVLGPRHAGAGERLEEARCVRAECERTLEAARTLRSRATALAERLTEQRERSERCQGMAEQARAESRHRRSALVEMEQARHAVEEVARAAENHLRHLERAHAAHTLRAALAAGQPCPVCETRVSRVPAVEPLDDLEGARRALEDAREHLAEARRSEQLAAAGLAAADEAVRASTVTAQEIRSEVDRLTAELQGVLPPEFHVDVRWPDVLQARVDAAAAARAAAEQDVQDARGCVAEIETAMAGIGGELGTLPARVEEQRQALRAIRGRCEETERLLAALLGRPPGPDAAAELAAIDARLREAEDALALAAAGVDSARERLREAQLAEGRAGRELDAEAERARKRAQERAGLAGERDDIQRALQEVVPGRVDAAAAIVAELAALVDARARRDEIGRELRVCQQARERAARHVTELAARTAELERQLDGHRERERSARRAMEAALAELASRLVAADRTLAGEGDEHDQLREAVPRARADQDAAVRRAAALAAEEHALAEKIRRAAGCREQRDTARTRAEVGRELGQLLGANNLQTYVLADAMRVLVEDGSEHLRRLSDGRYRLRAEDLDFHVVDAWNGDAVRSVKTLSGGETFLTSLALALALAERLADLAAGAHGHEALESLFVDEGFGALDTEETLETVVQAIEALQAHDRLVGIVTHLTPLAERMPARVKVRKAPEGSRVEMVR
jgi:DNA repair protein SbcC/Rad50